MRFPVLVNMRNVHPNAFFLVYMNENFFRFLSEKGICKVKEHVRIQFHQKLPKWLYSFTVLSAMGENSYSSVT